MVNSKRMSKSKVAMIALAILLVLSLILTATGAWFTDTEAGMSATGAVKDFGHVELTQAVGADTGWSNQYSEVSGDDFVAMPGSRYDLAAGTITNSSNVKIYLLVKFDAVKLTLQTGAQKAANPEQAGTDYTATTNDICTIVQPGVTTTSSIVADGTHAGLYVVDAGVGTINITAGSVILDEAIGNTYQDGTAKVSYSVKIAAIQYANITAADAYTELLTLVGANS